MAVRHGTISEFNHGVKDWKTYVERVNLYLSANDITDSGKKRAIFLSVCGPKTFHTIRNLVTPSKPTNLEYDEIVKEAQEHYNPTPVGGCSATSLIPVFVSRRNQSLRLSQPYGI